MDASAAGFIKSQDYNFKIIFSQEIKPAKAATTKYHVT